MEVWTNDVLAFCGILKQKNNFLAILVNIFGILIFHVERAGERVYQTYIFGTWSCYVFNAAKANFLVILEYFLEHLILVERGRDLCEVNEAFAQMRDSHCELRSDDIY